MLEKSLKILTIIIAAMTLVVAWLLVNKHLAQKEWEMKNSAVQGCMEIASYTFTDPKQGVTTVEPIEKDYKECLKLKGY